jgi:hypothetical protein
MFGMSEFSRKVWDKLRKKVYRRAYVEEHVRRWIASQIRAMRDHPSRQWNQGEFSRRIKKPQSVVSRLEDPSYGKMTIQTLLEVAAAFDVALIVKFVSFCRFLRETNDLTIESMQVENFDIEDARVASPILLTETLVLGSYGNPITPTVGPGSMAASASMVAPGNPTMANAVSQAMRFQPALSTELNEDGRTQNNAYIIPRNADMEALRSLPFNIQ